MKKYEITTDLAAKHSFNLKNALQKYCIPHHSKENFDNDDLYTNFKPRWNDRMQFTLVETRDAPHEQRTQSA